MKLLLTVLVAAYALASVAIGTDRIGGATGETPQFAFAAQLPAVSRIEASRALQANEDKAKNAIAQALSDDPLDYRHAGIMGAAALRAGQSGLADRAFVTASRLSWRDPVTGLYMYGRAARMGEWAEAIRRLDVILSTRSYPEDENGLMATVEESDAGREALFSFLAEEKPDWAPRYLTPLDDPDQSLLKRRAGWLSQSNVAQGCERIRQPVAELFRTGWRKEAEQLWLSQCQRSQEVPLLADPQFASLSGEEVDGAPFEWTAHRSGDVSIRGGEGLSLRSTSSAMRLALSQPVALSPGEWQVRADTSTPDAFAYSVDCAKQPRRASARDDEVAFAVPTQNCDRQVFGLWIAGGKAGDIDRIELERVSPR